MMCEVGEAMREGQYDWGVFCDRRIECLTALAEVVERSFLRKDTGHPVFCGCIDWHSSVHGAYALLVAARLTGQTRWAELVDSTLQAEGLLKEMEALRCGALDHELPYGYAWFLKLARERGRAWGQSDLLPLAAEMAARLQDWLLALSDTDVGRHVQRREYGNLSWALVNLWEWAKWKGIRKLENQLRTFTREKVVSQNEEWFGRPKEVPDEFFSPALQRARAILSILPEEGCDRWLKSRLLESADVVPLTICSTPHSAGLNFSRAWGLWGLYQATKDRKVRQAYVAHILTHMDRPEFWRDDYGKHGHWVPQFGIHALALSVEQDNPNG